MRYTLPPDLAWVIDDSLGESRLYLLSLPAGIPIVLDGNAAAVWVHAVDFGEHDEVIEALAQSYDVERSVVDAGAVEFLDTLVSRGLLLVDP